MADNNVIGIKFGVKGGKGFLADSSGALIKEQLLSIAERIHPKVKISLDEKYFKSQLSNLKKELDATLGKLDINIRTRNATRILGDQADVKEQEISYESLRKELENLYKTRERLAKMPKTEQGDYASVEGQILAQREQELTESYKESLEAYKQRGDELDATDKKRADSIREQIALLTEYETKLQGAAQAVPSPKMATEVDLAKLGLKAQSLYTDNGFDKVIARSREAMSIVDNFNAKVQAVLDNPDSVTKDQVAALNAEFLDTEKRLKEIEVETDTVGNRFKEAFGTHIIQNLASKAWLLILTYLKKVYQNVVQINKAMTQLQIVTRATSDQLSAAAKNITKSAREIGASVVDLINSTTVYARLGYTLEQAQSLAKNTTMYANITGVDVNEATTNVTGAIKAYGLSVDQLEETLDKFIWVGNKFAISQAEIGEAMNNAAASLRAGGNSIDEAMAILAAANASVQNISKSSTGIRTIVARINASEADLIELGEDAGDIISTAKLDEIMRGYGVAITDVNGQLRSTYDILNDLAKVWNDELKDDNLAKSAIGEMFAGKRQREVFESLMNNWGDAQKVMQGIASSTGSLSEAQGIYIDSIEGKSKRLQATWEEFSQSLLDSDIVKFFIDFLNVITQVLNAFIGFGDGVVPKFALVVAATAGAIAIFNKLVPIIQTARLQFKLFGMELGVHASGIVGFFKTVGVAIKNFMAKYAPMLIIGTIITLMTTLEGKAQGFTEVIVGLITIIATVIIAAIKSVDGAIKGFMATNPIGWILLAITAVVSVVKGIFDLIESFNPSYDTLKETAQESKDAWKETADELDEVNQKLDEIQERIDEINKKGDKISLVDKEELEYLEQEKNNLEALAASKATQEEAAKKRAASDAANALGKYNDTHTVSDAPWYEWLLIGPLAFIHQGIAWGSDTQEEKFDKILKDFQNASDEDKQFIEQTLKEYGEMLDGFDFGDSEELDPYLRQYFSLVDRYNNQTGNAPVTWQRVLSDKRFTGEVQSLKDLANAQAVSIDSIAERAPQFLEYLKEIGMYTDGDTASANALVESIKALRDKLEAKTRVGFTDDLEMMQDKFDALQNALSDIEDNGVVSMDNIGKILDAEAEGYPELLSKYFKYVEGIGYQLTDRWTSAPKSEVLAAMAKDEIQNYAKELSDAQDILAGMSEDDEDYATAVNNVAVAQDNLNSKITEWATLLREQALEDQTELMEKQKEALEDQLDTYKDLIEMRKDLLETYKEERDYQKELAQKQKAVADLQTQVALAALDNSAAGQARARELQEQLQEAQDELDDYTLERAIDDLTRQLDQDYDEYEQFIDEQVQIIVDAIERLKREFKIDLTPNSDGSVTVESHHSGGFVGDTIALRSNEEFAKLLKGEFVSTPKQMDEFMRKTLPAIVSHESGGGATINNNSPLVEIHCGSVDKDTLPQLQDLVNQAVKKIGQDMESALHRAGHKKQF